MFQAELENEVAEATAARTMYAEQKAEAAAAQLQSALEAEHAAAEAADSSNRGRYDSGCASYSKCGYRGCYAGRPRTQWRVQDAPAQQLAGTGAPVHGDSKAVEQNHVQRAKRVLAEGALNDARAGEAVLEQQLVAAKSEASQLRQS